MANGKDTSEEWQRLCGDSKQYNFPYFFTVTSNSARVIFDSDGVGLLHKGFKLKWISVSGNLLFLFLKL